MKIVVDAEGLKAVESLCNLALKGFTSDLNMILGKIVLEEPHGNRPGNSNDDGQPPAEGG